MKFPSQSCPHQWPWHNEIALELRRAGGRRRGGDKASTLGRSICSLALGNSAADLTLGSKAGAGKK